MDSLMLKANIDKPQTQKLSTMSIRLLKCAVTQEGRLRGTGQYSDTDKRITRTNQQYQKFPDKGSGGIRGLHIVADFCL